jgi:hypothetical protein
MVSGADRPRDNRRGSGTKPDRHTGYDHQYRETKGVCGQCAIADAAEKPRINERLAHHRNDAE